MEYDRSVDHEPTRATEKELLAEQLSDAEVRHLLERLSVEEFELPGGATVGAVVEATGASPVIIARIVGEVRRGSFEARFEDTFGRHEDHLEELHSRVSSLESSQPQFRKSKNELIVEALEREAKARNRAEPWILWGVVIAVAAILATLSFLVR